MIKPLPLIFSLSLTLVLFACGTQNQMVNQRNNPDSMPSLLIPQTIPSASHPETVVISTFENEMNNDYLMSDAAMEDRLGIRIEADDNIQLLRELASWVGVPYKHAHNDKMGTDCSGLSFAVFKKLYNKNLERSSDGQYIKNCVKVNRTSARTGDLVFFAINNKRQISHVGIYLKNDKFIHASSYKGVVVSDLNDDYYRKYFYAFGRVR